MAACRSPLLDFTAVTELDVSVCVCVLCCRPLFLTPKNEAGVRKLVCTTLRPTLLPHTDLYDLPGIVQFVASYFAYEPLANPVHYPDFLPSPSSVISWQVIDSTSASCVSRALFDQLMNHST